MQETSENNIEKLERAISILIMLEDAETIFSLLESERDSIFVMAVMPYYALFIQSCQELLGEEHIDNSEIAKKIKDIRNYIKTYGNSFGKSKKRVCDADLKQDEQFRSLLRFDFMKKWNIHYNMGTYWTDERKIIGNTQMMNDFLEMDNDSKTLEEKYKELGYQIGSFVSDLRETLSKLFLLPKVNRNHTGIKIRYYSDLNTNRKNKLFDSSKPKELNLFYLNLLCSLNFVEYVLSLLLDKDNWWLFRIRYIVTYYSYKALQRLANYCENNSDIEIDLESLHNILNVDGVFFQSKFRNCMMHYGLENQNVLSAENLDKSLYGLVENCFFDKSFYSYSEELRELSRKIIAYLESNIDGKDIVLKKL